MKNIPLLLLSLAGFAGAEPTAIFDGKSLDGWRVQGAPYWTVVDGVLVGESDDHKKNSILWTKKDYGDFEMTLEFRFEGRIDSGVFLRQENDQIQIGVSGSLKRDMTASPYIANKRGYPVEARGVAELLKEGEWNSMTIRAKGPEYVVSLNGAEVMKFESTTSKAKGPVGLQVHPGLKMKIEFREMAIQPLD